MGTAESPVRIGTTADRGCLIQIIGRGTMQYSPSVEGLVTQTLQRDAEIPIAIDLNACTYLDSTFLGCLFGLFRKYVQKVQGTSRLHFYGSAKRIHDLFGPLHLDKIFHAEEAPPTPAGPMLPLDASPADRKAVSKHVMECHRRLAEMDTPAKAAFTKIADLMEQELSKD